jgi:hypothetical protein
MFGLHAIHAVAEEYDVVYSIVVTCTGPEHRADIQVKWDSMDVGRAFQTGQWEPVTEGERSHSSKLVANKPLGSEASYRLIFRLMWLGRSPSTLFGPGPISRTEIQVRKLKRGPSSCDS